MRQKAVHNIIFFSMGWDVDLFRPRMTWNQSNLPEARPKDPGRIPSSGYKKKKKTRILVERNGRTANT